MKAIANSKILENIDTKTAIVAGVGTIVTLVLSYWVYKRVQVPESTVEPAKLTGKIKLRYPQKDDSRKE